MTYRCFIALPLPAPVKQALGLVQARLEAQVPMTTLRWNNPQQLHLTLDFLGDVPTEELETITAHLDRACRGVVPFELQLGALGSFGHPPRVLWIGVEGDLTDLHALQGRLVLSPDPKPFRPHLTLARSRGGFHFPKKLARAAETLRWQVAEVCLFRSELHFEGARYTPLHCAGLA